MAHVHIGKKIKEIVGRSNFSVTEFAKNINRSRDVAYKIFAKDNIDTVLLERISKVLNHDFFSYYSNELPPAARGTVVEDPLTPYGRREDMLRQMNAELKACKKQISDLEKRYELSEKLNRLMEEKLEGMKKSRK